MVQTLSLIILFVINILLVTAEEAISSSNAVRVRRRADEGHKQAQKLYDIIKKDLDVEAALYIGQVLTVTSLSACAALLIYEYFIFDNVYGFVVYLILVLIASYVIMFAARLVAYVIVRNEPEKAAYMLVGFVLTVIKLLKPLIRLLMFSGDGITKRFEHNAALKEQEDYEEEVHDIVEASAEQGKITEENVEMISNVFDFGDETAGDIAVHRKGIEAFCIDKGIEGMVEVLLNQKHSRFPVYEENIDNIIGILHVKDLLQYILLGKKIEDLNLRDILRKPYFTPISKKANELFKEMQINKTHIAIVVDEYGGTEGIVTMEDLIEEIMGSILDEYDEEEIPEIEKIDENTYRISGTADLEDIEEILGTQFPVYDYETLGGFLIGQLGHIPSDGERPEIEYGEYLFKCDKISERRIDSVLVCKLGAL